MGELNHEQLLEKYKEYHAFIFPTLGENFGHVIDESIKNGCPVILSRSVTPWDDYIDYIQLGGSLGKIDEFRKSVLTLLKTSQEQYNEFIIKNNEYIERNNSEYIKEQYYKLFLSCL